MAKATIYLQFGGNEVSLETVEKCVKDDYSSDKKGKDQPKDVKIYLKPEDGKAYYVINEDYAGAVPLFPEQPAE